MEISMKNLKCALMISGALVGVHGSVQAMKKNNGSVEHPNRYAALVGLEEASAAANAYEEMVRRENQRLVDAARAGEMGDSMVMTPQPSAGNPRVETPAPSTSWLGWLLGYGRITSEKQKPTPSMPSVNTKPTTTAPSRPPMKLRGDKEMSGTVVQTPPTGWIGWLSYKVWGK
jgi:hypothetical protein